MSYLNFCKTTKGVIGEVNGATNWFIRKDFNDEFSVYKNEDGKNGFRRLAHFPTLEQAKLFVSDTELNSQKTQNQSN